MVRLFSYFIAILLFATFCAGCSGSGSKRADNQLKRFLHNDSVRFSFAIHVDTTNKSIILFSDASDFETKMTYPFPGILYLDKKFVTLTKQGSVITPNITQTPSEFEGKHTVSLLFSDDMDYDWIHEKLTSSEQDSIHINFETVFFDIERPIKTRNDSLIITTNRPVPDCDIMLEMVPVDNPEANIGIISVSAPVINGRAAIPLSSFVKKGISAYSSIVFFRKEVPVLYKGKKKGSFSYQYGVKPVQIKI